MFVHDLLLVAFVAFQAIDYWTTVRALELRNMEINPTMRALQSRLGLRVGTLVAKLTAIAIVVMLEALGWLPLPALLLVVAFYAIVCAMNLRAIALKERGR